MYIYIFIYIYISIYMTSMHHLQKHHQFCSNSSKVSSKKKHHVSSLHQFLEGLDLDLLKKRQGVERQAGSGGGKEAIGTLAENDRKKTHGWKLRSMVTINGLFHLLINGILYIEIIYIHGWLIFMANVTKYTMTGFL